MSSAAPQPQMSRPEPQAILEYLKILGYAADPEPGEAVLSTEQQLKPALKAYQQFYELPVTGELDEATSTQLRAPRCSNPDPQPGLESTEFGSTWQMKNVTYFCDSVPSGVGVPRVVDRVGGLIGSDLAKLDDQTFNTVVDQSFRTWATVSGLTFSRTTDRSAANIILSFSTLQSLTLGMPGGTLGVGAAPPALGHRSELKDANGATIVLDSSERWFPFAFRSQETSLAKISGQVLDSVVLHEIGHALGLNHSRNRAALMFPTDSGLPILLPDDIFGIRALYVQPGTDLEETDSRFDFAIGPNDDLFVINKRGTGSGHTEIHVLSALTNYRNFSLHVPTALAESGDNFQFAVASNGDLFAIKKNNTGSHSTEIHVLSAATNYAAFVKQTGTPLEETGDAFSFAVADNRDVFAFKRANTGSHTTEVHILDAASGYTRFSLHTPTALEEVGASFFLGVQPNRDVIAVKTQGTGSFATEVHILSAASGYRNFSLHTPTTFVQLDDRFVVVPKRDGDILIIQKNGTASHRTEVHPIQVNN